MATTDNAKENIELLKQVRQMSDENFRLQQENQRLQVQVGELTQQVEELQAQLNAPPEMICRDDLYFRTVSGREEGPFCTGCWDTKKLAVRMKLETGRVFMCPSCGHHVIKKGQPPQGRAIYRK